MKHLRISLRRTAILAGTLTGLACGGSGGDGAATARAPTSAGQVWEVDRPDNRASAAATLLAYANGLHVVVVDGNQIYAGMTRLKAAPGPSGAPTLTLGNGLTAELAQAGEGLEFHFSTGETVVLHKQAPRQER